jgi:hypothetical protein
MKCFHRTYNAEHILSGGFRDATGYYLTGDLHTGVWFSDVPLDRSEGADGDILLSLDIPLEVFAAHEWVEEGKPYREALIPADIINRCGTPRIEDCDHGDSVSDLLTAIARLEAIDSPHARERAERVKQLIPLLEKHGPIGGQQQ